MRGLIRVLEKYDMLTIALLKLFYQNTMKKYSSNANKEREIPVSAKTD